MAITALLITLVVTAASSALSTQKRANTEAVFKAVDLALDQFKTLDPLKMTYSARGNATFGPYPPYMLFGNRNDSTRRTVAAILNENYPANAPANLQERLLRDLGGQGQTASNWVRIADPTNTNNPTRFDDDNRALAAYLNIYVPDAFAQIPQYALKPLTNDPNGEFVSTSGRAGGNLNDPNVQSAKTPLLGIHDAWGVPLDYMLAVRLEYAPDDTGFVRPLVRERTPVLRSKGIERELYDAQPRSSTPQPGASAKWLFSRELATPGSAGIDNSNGAFRNPTPNEVNGWLRPVAGWGTAANQREDYGYRPDQDKP